MIRTLLLASLLVPTVAVAQQTTTPDPNATAVCKSLPKIGWLVDDPKIILDFVNASSAENMAVMFVVSPVKGEINYIAYPICTNTP